MSTDDIISCIAFYGITRRNDVSREAGDKYCIVIQIAFETTNDENFLFD